MAQTFLFLVNEDRASKVLEEGMQVWDKYFAPHMKDMQGRIQDLSIGGRRRHNHKKYNTYINSYKHTMYIKL
jgi:hypothetical protein